MLFTKHGQLPLPEFPVCKLNSKVKLSTIFRCNPYIFSKTMGRYRTVDAYLFRPPALISDIHPHLNAIVLCKGD
jgi:hypothetical protein